MKVDPVSLQSLQQGDAAGKPYAPFTNREIRASLQREVHLRKAVYPGLVRRGRMTNVEADREIAIFEYLFREYDSTKEDEKSPQADLLDTPVTDESPAPVAASTGTDNPSAVSAPEISAPQPEPEQSHQTPSDELHHRAT